MEKIKDETYLTSRYVDNIGIVMFVEIAKSDDQLGKMVRQHISQCREYYKNDDAFANVGIGTRPSNYHDSIIAIYGEK